MENSGNEILCYMLNVSSFPISTEMPKLMRYGKHLSLLETRERYHLFTRVGGRQKEGDIWLLSKIKPDFIKAVRTVIISIVQLQQRRGPRIN